MYYVIEQSTDMRCKNTKIRKFRSVKSAKQYASHGGFYTHDNPEEARNYHHTFREVYEFCGRMNAKILSEYKNTGTSFYPVSDNDAIAKYLWKYGKEIE